MVASLLKIDNRCGWSVWLLVLLLWSATGPSSALGGRLLEEDIPPEPARTESPVVPPLASVPAAPVPGQTNPPVALPPVSLPVSPQPFMGREAPFVREMPSVITNAPPPLPEKDTLPPQEVVALRFVEEGKEALERGEVQQARARFERAMSVAPLQPYSYYFLGQLAFTRGEHKQALAFLQRAELLFAPKDRAWRGEAAGLKGTVYEDLGDYAKARAAYQRCLRFTPSHLKALSAVARLSVEEPLPSEIPPQ
ncbi:MAG: tetratricopeptide repeat protein, partial [Candidatus Binatia bacterium]